MSLFSNPSHHVSMSSQTEREKEGSKWDRANSRARGSRQWRLMSFHKAADAPSNSINSLASTKWHWLNPRWNDIREYGSFFFSVFHGNPCNVFAHPGLTQASAPCHSHLTGVMDWQELIMKPNSNRSFDYPWQKPPRKHNYLRHMGGTPRTC